MRVLNERSAAPKRELRWAGNLPRVDRLAVKSAGEISFLKFSDIDWIEAADYYACLHVGPRTHLLRRSMSDLEDELDEARFCRIHRSTIVNLDRVRASKTRRGWRTPGAAPEWHQPALEPALPQATAGAARNSAARVAASDKVRLTLQSAGVL